MVCVDPTDDDLEEDLSETEAPKVKKKKKAKKSSREGKSSKRPRSRREVGLTDAAAMANILASHFYKLFSEWLSLFTVL